MMHSTPNPVAAPPAGKQNGDAQGMPTGSTKAGGTPLAFTLDSVSGKDVRKYLVSSPELNFFSSVSRDLQSRRGRLAAILLCDSPARHAMLPATEPTVSVLISPSADGGGEVQLPTNESVLKAAPGVSTRAQSATTLPYLQEPLSPYGWGTRQFPYLRSYAQSSPMSSGSVGVASTPWQSDGARAGEVRGRAVGRLHYHGSSGTTGSPPLVSSPALTTDPLVRQMTGQWVPSGSAVHQPSVYRPRSASPCSAATTTTASASTSQLSRRDRLILEAFDWTNEARHDSFRPLRNALLSRRERPSSGRPVTGGRASTADRRTRTHSPARTDRHNRTRMPPQSDRHAHSPSQTDRRIDSAAPPVLRSGGSDSAAGSDSGPAREGSSPMFISPLGSSSDVYVAGTVRASGWREALAAQWRSPTITHHTHHHHRYQPQHHRQRHGSSGDLPSSSPYDTSPSSYHFSSYTAGGRPSSRHVRHRNGARIYDAHAEPRDRTTPPSSEWVSSWAEEGRASGPSSRVSRISTPASVLALSTPGADSSRSSLHSLSPLPSEAPGTAHYASQPTHQAGYAPTHQAGSEQFSPSQTRTPSHHTPSSHGISSLPVSGGALQHSPVGSPEASGIPHMTSLAGDSGFAPMTSLPDSTPHHSAAQGTASAHPPHSHHLEDSGLLTPRVLDRSAEPGSSSLAFMSPLPDL